MEQKNKALNELISKGSLKIDSQPSHTLTKKGMAGEHLIAELEYEEGGLEHGWPDREEVSQIAQMQTLVSFPSTPEKLTGLKFKKNDLLQTSFPGATGVLRFATNEGIRGLENFLGTSKRKRHRKGRS